MMHIPVESVPEDLLRKMSKYKPDRYVVFKIDKNNSHVETIRFIQEDKPAIISANELHEDFLKLAKELRAAHRHLLNTVFVSKKRNFHDCLATYGILTTKTHVEIIALTSTIVMEQFSYNLHYIGRFEFDKQSIELTACLLSLFHSTEKEKSVLESYLAEFKTTKTTVLNSSQKADNWLREGTKIVLRLSDKDVDYCISKIFDNDGTKFVFATEHNTV